MGAATAPLPAAALLLYLSAGPTSLQQGAPPPPVAIGMILQQQNPSACAKAEYGVKWPSLIFFLA